MEETQPTPREQVPAQDEQQRRDEKPAKDKPAERR